MLVINQEMPKHRRGWLRLPSAAVALIGVVISFASGGVVGALAVRDGRVREALMVSASRVIHAGNFVRAVARSAELETLRLDIGDGPMASITEARNRALEQGILFRDDQSWHRARMMLGDNAVPIRLRLKGLMDDHRNTDKWSFRIEMPAETPWRGMTAFSIQHPKTREFLDEWLYREMMRAEDLLAPRYGFVDVVLNGHRRGIYAFEEHFTSRVWLDMQRRRDGIIVRMDDSDIWVQQQSLGAHFGTVFPVGFANTAVHEFRAGRAQRSEALRGQRDAAIRLLVEFAAGERRGSEVFDIAMTSRFLALQELWSCDHVLGPPNARFYFNPVTARLEPIAGDTEPVFDRGPFLVSLPPYHGDGRDVGTSVFWPPLYLRDHRAMEAYIRELNRITRPGYLEQVKAGLDEQADTYLWALRREYAHVQPRWNELTARQEQLRAMLEVPRMVLAYGQVDEQGLAIRIGNTLSLPVEVLSIQIDDQPPVPAACALRPGQAATILDGRGTVVLDRKEFHQSMNYAGFVLEAPHLGRNDRPATSRSTYRPTPDTPPVTQVAPAVRIRTRILGHDREITAEARIGEETISAGSLMPEAPALQETLARHPMLEESEDGVRIRPGEWSITEDITLPEGISLWVGPGTTLRFAPEALLLARGPVRFIGSEISPIVMEPIGTSWPGMVVLGASGPSVLRHVTIRATRGIDRGGWFVVGAVTFYESPVTLEHCRFIDSIAEDSLNIIRTTFELKSSEFTGCISDSFDGDFTEGLVASCTFTDVGGDAIDVSGSRIRVRDVIARRINDKAISAGEDSHVVIDGLIVEQAHYGIASKDLSSVWGGDVDIRSARVGLAAFVKKPAYGPASIELHGVAFREVLRETLVQRGSQIRLDGILATGSDVDVQALYDEEHVRSSFARRGRDGDSGGDRHERDHH